MGKRGNKEIIISVNPCNLWALFFQGAGQLPAFLILIRVIRAICAICGSDIYEKSMCSKKNRCAPEKIEDENGTDRFLYYLTRKCFKAVVLQKRCNDPGKLA